jgi:hypothetical protein
MSGAIEFDCEGCGDHVFSFGRATVPAHRFCAVCEWFNEHVPPAEMMKLRKAMGLLNVERKPR